MTSPPTGPADRGAQDECATCGHARWRHKEVDGQQVCTEYVDCACGGHFVELSPATRMARVISAAGDLAHQFADFRAALQGTMRSLRGLHTAMQVAGLLPEEDQADDRAGRHHAERAAPACPIDGEPLAETISAWASGPTVYRHTDGTTHPDRSAELRHFPELAGTLSDALDVPAALLAGPSLDGLPDHWKDAAPVTPHPDEVSSVGNSCATCWPRPCDPARSMCRRNPDVTQSMPAVPDADQGDTQ